MASPAVAGGRPTPPAAEKQAKVLAIGVDHDAAGKTAIGFRPEGAGKTFPRRNRRDGPVAPENGSDSWNQTSPFNGKDRN
jgi:hypothetical protein